MNKNDNLVIICMFIGMILGVAIGYVMGIYKGSVGTTMCYGLVLEC